MSTTSFIFTGTRKHSQRTAWGLVAAYAVTLLMGCATQPPYTKPAVKVPSTWASLGNNSLAAPQASGMQNDAWWRALRDPAVDRIVDTALADNPMLGQAIARVDEAQAVLGINAARHQPFIGAGGGISRAQMPDTLQLGSGPTVMATSAQAGLGMLWEVDVWGRVREATEAARSRLDSRHAAAQAVRLRLTAEVATTVLALRACNYSRQVLAEDIASRERTLELARKRVAVGFGAPVDVARAINGIATVRTNLADREAQCTTNVNALVALSGLDANTVRQQILMPLPDAIVIPIPPATQPALPAVVLTAHPSVVAAEREAAAAWSEIGIARASRLPRIDLAGLLAHQWLRSADMALSFTSWSIGSNFAATLFDAGAGAAQVDAAEARYRQALNALHATVRSAGEEVENALSAATTAQGRLGESRVSADAARSVLKAIDNRWQAGAASMFELEDTRRQDAAAQESAIFAARDYAQAWVKLIRATGNAIAVAPQ